MSFVFFFSFSFFSLTFHFLLLFVALHLPFPLLLPQLPLALSFHPLLPTGTYDLRKYRIYVLWSVRKITHYERKFFILFDARRVQLPLVWNVKQFKRSTSYTYRMDNNWSRHYDQRINTVVKLRPTAGVLQTTGKRVTREWKLNDCSFFSLFLFFLNFYAQSQASRRVAFWCVCKCSTNTCPSCCNKDT